MRKFFASFGRALCPALLECRIRTQFLLFLLALLVVCFALAGAVLTFPLWRLPGTVVLGLCATLWILYKWLYKKHKTALQIQAGQDAKTCCDFLYYAVNTFKNANPRFQFPIPLQPTPDIEDIAADGSIEWRGEVPVIAVSLPIQRQTTDENAAGDMAKVLQGLVPSFYRHNRETPPAAYDNGYEYLTVLSVEARELKAIVKVVCVNSWKAVELMHGMEAEKRRTPPPIGVVIDEDFL